MHVCIYNIACNGRTNLPGRELLGENFLCPPSCFFDAHIILFTLVISSSCTSIHTIGQCHAMLLLWTLSGLCKRTHVRYVSVRVCVCLCLCLCMCLCVRMTHIQIHSKLSQGLPTSNFQSTCRGTSCRPRCYVVGHMGRRRVGRKRQTRGRRRQYKGGGARGRVRQQVQTSCTLGATAFELRALCTGESRWPF